MTENKRELLNILILLAIALVLLTFVEPGMVESPYNEF